MDRQRQNGRRLATLAALLFVLLLSGCGTATERRAAPDTVGALPARSDVAWVVISAGQEHADRHGPRRTAIASQWTLSTPPGEAPAVVLTADDAARPFVTQVRAGRYQLQSFAFGIGGQLYSGAGGLRNQSLAEFAAGPGEVIYVGHLLVKTRNGLLGTLANDFRLAVENHEAKARAQLQRTDPTLAARLQTRLITLAPLLQRLSQLP